YRFVYADGHVIDVPIRERFEIGITPCDWGELPFLAVPETDDLLMARYEGPWESTGFRQTEARQAWPQTYYLWCWRNPRPEVVIERIEICHGDTETRGGGDAATEHRTPDAECPTPNTQHPTPSFFIAAIT